MKASLYVFFALLTALAVCSQTYADSKDLQQGLRYYGKKDYRSAEKYLKNYTSVTPDPAAYYLLGYAEYKLKKFDEANRYFKEAYLIDPDISARTAYVTKKGRKK